MQVIRCPELLAKEWLKHISKGTGCLWVATVKEKPVGTIGFLKTDEESAELVRLVVHPDYRGQGYGKELVQFLIRSTKVIGFNRIHLHSYIKQIDVIKLYLQSGFKVDSTETIVLFLKIFSLQVKHMSLDI